MGFPWTTKARTRKRYRSLQQKAAETNSVVCGTMVDGEWVHWLMPEGVPDEDVAREAFRRREGRDLLQMESFVLGQAMKRRQDA